MAARAHHDQIPSEVVRRDAHEVEGVLNPAVARGRDGQLYLLPRLVGRGNRSRIGIARVRFDASGDPAGVERLGIALEPAADYERNGCEDPRVTFFAPLDRYVMTYTAFSDRGPRVALAVSADLFRWERLGLVRSVVDHLAGVAHPMIAVRARRARGRLEASRALRSYRRRVRGDHLLRDHQIGPRFDERPWEVRSVPSAAAKSRKTSAIPTPMERGRAAARTTMTQPSSSGEINDRWRGEWRPNL